MSENEPNRCETHDEKPDLQATAVEENPVQNEELKKRSYYYDDSCGYEIYQPDENDEEENSQ